jgi:hypothetical protein
MRGERIEKRLSILRRDVVVGRGERARNGDLKAHVPCDHAVALQAIEGRERLDPHRCIAGLETDRFRVDPARMRKRLYSRNALLLASRMTKGGSSGSSSNAGCLFNCWLIIPTQMRLAPVSPSGSRRTFDPIQPQTVRNTVSVSVSGTLPTRCTANAPRSAGLEAEFSAAALIQIPPILEVVPLSIEAEPSRRRQADRQYSVASDASIAPVASAVRADGASILEAESPVSVLQH